MKIYKNTNIHYSEFKQIAVWLALQYSGRDYKDPAGAELWIAELESAITAIQNIENESLSSHLSNLTQASNGIPSPGLVTSEDSRNWQPEDPTVWLERLDSGANLI